MLTPEPSTPICPLFTPFQVWQSLFTVRQLVVPMHEDVDNWLKVRGGRERNQERGSILLSESRSYHVVHILSTEW